MRRLGSMLSLVALGVLLAALVTGCVHKYAVPQAAESKQLLPANASVYVATPLDGRDDRPRTYKASGEWTASALADALRDRGATVVLGGPQAGPSEAIDEARAAEADFLAYSRIDHWSDRLTEWSGIPDRITLRVSLYDVRTRAVLDQREIKASSRWGTFGGDHPQELLPELTRRWAETVMP